MKTNATVLADSLTPTGARLTTLQVCFPRFILAEVNTHRMLSRNYRSSRAVPVAKLVEEVRTEPFVPLAFLKNKPGMQGGEVLDDAKTNEARTTWLAAARDAANHAEWMALAGVHKQLANRIIEPYLYVHGVISATEWDNLFALRCHPDAQPEFQELACAMRDAIASSTPVGRGVEIRSRASWHLPYISDDERESMPIGTLLQLSAARCAWVSYKPFDPDQAGDVEKALRTFSKLADSVPMHASPLEHQGTPALPRGSGNYYGWQQFRHLYETMGRVWIDRLDRQQ